MYQFQELFEGAIDIDWKPERPFGTPNPSLVAVLVHFSAAPTTSEDLIVLIATENGDAFETEIYSIDPSDGSKTDIFFDLRTPLPITAKESIKVAYPNSDTNTIGITLKAKYVR